MERTALNHLFSVTYEELRRLASTGKTLAPGRHGESHDAGQRGVIEARQFSRVASTSQLHFKRIAARAMRHVLIGAARRRQAGKRGGGSGIHVTFDDSREPLTARGEELLALDAALEELARMNPRQAMGRFFGGLHTAEIAGSCVRARLTS